MRNLQEVSFADYFFGETCCGAFASDSSVCIGNLGVVPWSRACVLRAFPMFFRRSLRRNLVIFVSVAMISSRCEYVSKRGLLRRLQQPVNPPEWFTMVTVATEIGYTGRRNPD